MERLSSRSSPSCRPGPFPLRICIVTPAALGSNPRVVKEAGALSEAGHDVRVVCARILASVDPRDDDILANAQFRCDRIDMRSAGRRALARLEQTLIRTLAPAGSEASDRAYSPLTTALMRRATAQPAELYIAHYVAALPAAAEAARRHDALLAFDAEDFHLGDPPEGPEHDAERAVVRRIEGRYLPRCCYVTAASPGIAEAYAQTYGLESPELVLNVFPRSLGPNSPTRAGTASGPSLYWFSQTLGPDRGLESAVQAAALARSAPHLYLRGLPAQGYREQLVALAEGLGMAERLHILDPAPPSALGRLAAEYDLGLVAETGFTPNHRIALSNKQFVYLLAGVPVLMSDTPGHRAFAEQAKGAAFLFKTEDAADLANRLDDLLLDADALAAARSRAHRLGHERFNWDNEKARLLARVELALQSARRP